MSIGWPEGILLALMFLTLCTHATKNGQPREDNYDLGTAMINAGLVLCLLWWGGFFA